MSTMDVRQYAAAVRAALGGLDPRAAAHLLDDLEEHLAEVAAESDVALAERLGPPESYAAELLAAYASGGGEPARSRPARRRRLAGAASVVVVLLAAVGFATWQLAARTEKVNPWSYDRLTTQARAGQVSRVEVTGNDVVAIDRAGQRHDIVDAARADDLAQVMTSEGVDMVFQPASSSFYWAAVLLPNLLLLVAPALVVGLAVFVAVLLRKPRPRPGTG